VRSSVVCFCLSDLPGASIARLRSEPKSADVGHPDHKPDRPPRQFTMPIVRPRLLSCSAVGGELTSHPPILTRRRPGRFLADADVKHEQRPTYFGGRVATMAEDDLSTVPISFTRVSVVAICAAVARALFLMMCPARPLPQSISRVRCAPSF
jgi:hypothetical protein